MVFQYFDPNLYLIHPYEIIINNGKDFIYHCGTSNPCHIGNALYFIADPIKQSLHYFSGCNNGSHSVRYVKNDEELSSITWCNMHPNHEDFYMYSHNDGIFSYIPSHVGYFVHHFSKYNIYYHDGGNSNNDGGNSDYANSYNYYHYNHHHHYSSYSFCYNDDNSNNDDDHSSNTIGDNSSFQREQGSNHNIDDTGSSIEPIENCETNTTVLSNNAATHTQHWSACNEGKLDIIDGVIWAVFNDCIVDLKLPSENDIITEWRKRGKGKNSVNSFILYRTVLSKNLEYKKSEFQNGDFQCYVSRFASKTWEKGKSTLAGTAIKNFAAAINRRIKLENSNPTLEG